MVLEKANPSAFTIDFALTRKWHYYFLQALFFLLAIFTKERLGAFLGKGLRSVAAIEQSGFIETVTREFAKYRNFFEGGTDAR